MWGDVKDKKITSADGVVEREVSSTDGRNEHWYRHYGKWYGDT